MEQKIRNRPLQSDYLKPEDQELLFLIQLSKKVEQKKQELKRPQVKNQQQDLLLDVSLLKKHHLRDQRPQ